MKNSTAYLRAAELFATGNNRNIGCCDVLATVINNCDAAYSLEELNMFKAPPEERRGFLEAWWWPPSDTEIRVLALCFMAAIAKDSERKKS